MTACISCPGLLFELRNSQPAKSRAGGLTRLADTAGLCDCMSRETRIESVRGHSLYISCTMLCLSRAPHPPAAPRTVQLALGQLAHPAGQALHQLRDTTHLLPFSWLP